MKYEFDIDELIDILKDGYFIKFDKYQIKYLTKFLCKKEIREPLKIEVGKFYKNKNGNKIYIYYQGKHSEYFIGVCKDEHQIWFKINGKASVPSGSWVGDLDIISEWTEEDEQEWRIKNENR